MKVRTRISAALLAVIMLIGCTACNSGVSGSGFTSQSSQQSDSSAADGSTDSNVSPDSSDASDITGEAPEASGQTSSQAFSDGTALTEEKPDSTTSAEEKPGDTSQSGSSADVGDDSLSPDGNGTEGSEATGSFNYGEALQKAILFYELQRSGDIDEETSRCNWRGDSGMSDGSDVGLDLTGGLYDAGDNVKFNFPMAYTSSMLAWSVYEDRDVYEKSGQLVYILDNIRWVNDYLIKCHPEDDVYYYQVGSGSADHAWWGAAEVMQMERPSYKVDINSPGSAVSAEAAASLAACAAVMKSTDKAYAEKCLAHAKQLYDFAERTKSDSGYTAANGFYNSWSGFYDELTWAACWLYIATEDKTYLEKAKKYEPECDDNHKWALCWDDKYNGALCLLSKLTGEQKYMTKLEKHLDWWTIGTDGERITYSPKGLAWLDQWGSLRYATTTAFLAAVYADSGCCPDSKAKIYRDFCASQVDYALGSTGRSFVVGFGENPPEHPHHRTAQGSWADNMNEPAYHRHTLYGALVGGPDASDGYTDSVSDYNKNEVADDYNAGFVGALAKMYGRYGGKTIKDFGAIEEKGEELYVEQKINAQGDGFTEIKAMIYNKTAWPARVTDNLELRYFVDLSELYEAGGSASDVSVTMNYSDGARFAGLYEWNKAENIYYVSIDFGGVKIYPGGQSAYKKEVQFRMLASSWNPGNDPSFAELVGTNGSELIRAANVGLYEDGKLVYGTTPDGKSAGLVTPGNSSGTGSQSTQPSQQEKPNQPSGQTQSGSTSAENNGLAVSVSAANGTSGNTIQFTASIVNNTGAAIDLSKLEIDYFFTADGKSGISFWCDHSATDGNGYAALTDSVKGEFMTADGKDTDTKCAITFTGGALGAGCTLTLQTRITPSDWTSFNLSNDYSGGGAEKICIKLSGKKIFGSEP